MPSPDNLQNRQEATVSAQNVDLLDKFGPKPPKWQEALRRLRAKRESSRSPRRISERTRLRRASLRLYLHRTTSRSTSKVSLVASRVPYSHRSTSQNTYAPFPLAPSLPDGVMAGLDQNETWMAEKDLASTVFLLVRTSN